MTEARVSQQGTEVHLAIDPRVNVSLYAPELHFAGISRAQITDQAVEVHFPGNAPLRAQVAVQAVEVHASIRLPSNAQISGQWIEVHVPLRTKLDTPVWTIRPNWAGGIQERLEWLTDVIMSDEGTEQRRSLRVSPRRSLEFTVHPTNNDRSRLDLQLHARGSEDWWVPLWWDKAKLSVTAEQGDLRINFDNTYREFFVGGRVILFRDTTIWETALIVGMDDDGLILDDRLKADWIKGTTVYPLRLARLSQDTSIDALTSTVGECVVLFNLVQANDYIAVEPVEQTFEGMPVITIPPNRANALKTDHMRLSEDRDNTVGIPYRRDSAGRAFGIQSHNWTITGRQAQAQFRSMLYWLRGRQRAVWLPSFNQDFVTSRASSITSVNLDIQKIGMGDVGGAVPGRDVIRVAGTPARVTAMGAPQSPTEERMRIGAGLTEAIRAGARGSFMSPVRLNQDEIEIMHHTDSDGTIECAATFRAFSNNRTTAGPIYVPIPDADME